MTIPTRYRLIDGAKSVPISALPEEAWVHLTGDSTPDGKSREYYDKVAYIRRCIDLRADSLINIPWKILRTTDDEEVWNSNEEEPPDELEWLSDLPDLLWLT